MRTVQLVACKELMCGPRVLPSSHSPSNLAAIAAEVSSLPSLPSSAPAPRSGTASGARGVHGTVQQRNRGGSPACVHWVRLHNAIATWLHRAAGGEERDCKRENEVATGFWFTIQLQKPFCCCFSLPFSHVTDFSHILFQFHLPNCGVISLR